MCGKNFEFLILAFSNLGSPPACAGKTLLPMFSPCVARDHPRVCGKNIARLLICLSCSGSPPRVREKPTVILTDDQALRITPACAGKTKALKSPLYYTQDHPRFCGKNHGFYFNGQKQMGSIPRLREKHNHSKGHFLRPRITLAYAGKTYLFLSYYLQS